MYWHGTYGTKRGVAPHMTLESSNPLLGLLIVGGVLLGMMLFCVLPMIWSARTLNKMEERDEELEQAYKDYEPSYYEPEEEEDEEPDVCDTCSEDPEDCGDQCIE